MNKTPEQQIDEIIEVLKSVLVCRTSNLHEQTYIKRTLDAFGHEMKASSAIINDNDVQKAAIHLILSRLIYNCNY